MASHKSYKNESQDARRHDQFHATHPDEKNHKQAREHQSSDKNFQKSKNKNERS